MKRYAVLLLMAGCAFEPVLVPDSTARKLGEKVAFTETQGVRVWINGDAWHGAPYDLEAMLTPVHVRIENTAQVPLQLAYADFSIVGETGMRYRALAPLQVGTPLHAVAWRGAPVRVAPRFQHRSFYVAPNYSYYYPGYPLWGAPFPYARYGSTWPQSLPSDDMIAEALPEGVLEPGGHVDGFVYFQGVTRREDRVRFDLKLIDADNQEQLGEAIVPLVVKLR